MTAEELFESVGFVEEYYAKMIDFYRDNFEPEKDMIVEPCINFLLKYIERKEAESND